jgi:hypothetical protein
LIKALAAWIADYNDHYLHSVLGYKPPRQFEREYHISHGTQLPAARQMGSITLSSGRLLRSS